MARAAVLAILVSGCTTLAADAQTGRDAGGAGGAKAGASSAAAAAPKGNPGDPVAIPRKTVTNFSDGLRCMDNLLLRFGTRDVSAMLEEMTDKTGKLPAGTRDMMISAVSDMTKRSRAVKLVAFGVDNRNIIDFLANLQKTNPFSLIPLYDIRGALSQFETDAERQQNGFGISFLNLFGIRAGTDKVVSVLAFDASVLQTSDLTLVNGVTSKNTMVITRQQSGGEASATIQKVGINFNSTFTQQESAAQALRNLVELSAIEIIGKLVKIPYWSCLGIPNDNAEVQLEIEDWFVGLRNPRDMNAFMQEQLRNRGFYDGPVDGRSNQALRDATAAYGKAIGVRADGRIDLPWFTAFLLKDVPPPPDEPFEVMDINPDQLGKLEFVLRTPKPQPGAPLEVEIRSSTDAYVYCYTQGENGKIQRFFPNRFARDPRVAANTPIVLPGRQRFGLRANAGGEVHRMACFSAAREIYNDLPPPLRWSDFDDVGFTNFQDFRQAFANAAKAKVNMTELVIPLTGEAPPAAAAETVPAPAAPATKAK